METVKVTPAALEAFQSFYLAELDGRIQRSEVVGAITLKKGNAALFYEQASGKFTLVEKLPEVEAANVFDCMPREQWGRTVMLFGHATQTGGFIASGHATVDGNWLKIKPASGHYYRIEVDPTPAHLQPFVTAEPVNAPHAKSSKVRRSPLRTNSGNVRQLDRPLMPHVPPKPPTPSDRPSVPKYQDNSHSDPDDESDDLTAEDLRRLRGELPLSTSSKKKWKR